MKNVSLDTNCLLRYFLEDISDQTKAVDKLLKETYKFNVSDMAISEFCFVLEKFYKLPRRQIGECLNRLINMENLNCNRTLFAKVIPVYTSSPALSIIDVCLMFYAELNNAVPLYTFDKKLALQGNGLAKLIK